MDEKRRHLDIGALSSVWEVRRIGEREVEEVYALFSENTEFYSYLRNGPSREEVREGMRELPPGKEPGDKYYLGFSGGDGLAAVIDLVMGYPDEETAFIGLFMVKRELQGKGLGSRVISEVLCALKKTGFCSVRLAYIKGNRGSRDFWRKNGFRETGEISEQEYGTAVLMRRELYTADGPGDRER